LVVRPRGIRPLIPTHQFTMSNISTIAERRAYVRTLWFNGMRNAHELSSITGLPLSTVYKYIAQLKETGKLDILPRSGRPKILTPRKRRQLGLLVSKDPYLTSNEMTIALQETYPELEVTDRTVRNTLQTLDYKVCRPITTTIMTSTHIARRLEWAQNHARDKSWKKTVFTDETTFQLFRNTIQVRHKNGKDVPHKCCPKHPLKVHVWGSFCAKGLVGFHIFEKNMNGELYRNSITENLFENAQRLLGKNWRLQQDNDPKHKAKKTMELIHAHCQNVLDWPSYSPDLNPIENLWSILKRRVEKDITKRIVKKQEVNKDIFHSLIRTHWLELDQNLLLKLVNSMPGRIKEVIESNGKRIKY
jgi:transposase